MLLSDPDIQFLTDVVAECSGNVIAPRQAYMLEKQLTPLAKSEGLADLSELVNKLRCHSDQKLKSLVAEAVTVNETSFFRDVHPFEALRKEIIPALIKKNHATRSIRIWCAACSCGQEPYTIAMVIREHFPNLSNWNIEIVATDISDEMLAKSKSGEYSQLEVNRGLPVTKLVKFFDRQGSKWQTKPMLKELIKFQKLNLTKAWPQVGQFDIVFIRNVLIYFEQATKSEILKRVHKVVRPEGYVFIGSVETTIGMGVPFQREEIDATVCYRPIG